MKKLPECLKMLTGIGIDLDDAFEIRRIAMTLRRWYEQELGSELPSKNGSSSIERHEKDKPYLVTHFDNGVIHRRLIADKEKGALKRLKAIEERYPWHMFYVNTDCRGPSVYVLSPQQIEFYKLTQESLEYSYNRGTPVYK